MHPIYFYYIYFLVWRVASSGAHLTNLNWVQRKQKPEWSPRLVERRRAVQRSAAAHLTTITGESYREEIVTSFLAVPSFAAGYRSKKRKELNDGME
jgi:hypothetical protein